VPLYEYQCTKCHKRTEKIESASGPHLKKCPFCRGKVEQLLSAPAIQFKGSGWYVTDYSGKKSGTGESSSAEKDGAKETPGKEGAKESGKESSKETGSKESKETKEKKTTKK
jgi:putative FmdB family regulatory protein